MKKSIFVWIFFLMFIIFLGGLCEKYSNSNKTSSDKYDRQVEYLFAIWEISCLNESDSVITFKFDSIRNEYQDIIKTDSIVQAKFDSIFAEFQLE